MSNAAAFTSRPFQLDAAKVLTFAAPFMLAAGLAHFIFQAWHHWDVVTLDFRFFWLAGDFWTAGQSPYQPEFGVRADEQFAIKQGAIWYYPPSWFLIASALSLGDPLVMSRIWLGVNCAFVLTSSWLNVAAFRTLADKNWLIDRRAPFTKLLLELSPWTLFAIHVGFLATTQAVGNTLHLGQSSALIYFGASALAFGVVRKQNISAIAGLTILMLKPQIGFMAVIALALSAFGRRTVFASAIASLIIAFPAILIDTPVDILTALVSGASQYNAQLYNLPEAMTGLRHIEWVLFQTSNSAGFYLGLCVLLVSAIVLAVRFFELKLHPGEKLFLVFVTTLLVAPMHVYDFTLVGVFALAAISLRRPYAAISASALLALWRPGNIPHPEWLTSDAVIYYPGSFYATIAVGAIFAILVMTPFISALREQ